MLATRSMFMLKAFEDMVHKDLVGPMQDYDSRVYVALRLADVCPKMEGGTGCSSSFHFGRLGVSITHSLLQGYGPQQTLTLHHAKVTAMQHSNCIQVCNIND